MSLASVYRLRGVVQHYDWGGRSFLPEILRINNVEQQAFAEYWLGTHPKGTADILIDDEWVNLAQAIEDQPEQWLGEAVLNRFGPELPFLFKILDVDRMLSIQLHPSKEEAEKGFAREEAQGIAPLAGHRNYKDRNHKPEFMLALTDFWLLHGCRSPQAIKQTLTDIPGWSGLLAVFEKGQVPDLYAYVMQLPQEEINELLQPLVERLEQHPPKEKWNPHYWAAQAVRDYSQDGHHDRGIFSIYWFNLVFLAEGEGIFQAAGIPHAYLEGVNVELMANSDNVLRGGLTPKHIDVPELLNNIVTETVRPEPLLGQVISAGLKQFSVPAEDFAFVEIHLSAGEERPFYEAGPSIYWVVEGEVSVEEDAFTVGDSFFVPHLQKIALRNDHEKAARLFRATVGDIMT